MKFALGQVVMTRGVAALIEGQPGLHGALLELLSCHVSGDWGNVCPEDWEANDAALAGGGRLLSVYELAARKIWIITEWDRSATTVLFPDEY
jgi:hypothetical protein